MDIANGEDVKSKNKNNGHYSNENLVILSHLKQFSSFYHYSHKAIMAE